jgi:Ca2+-dependent lipid-binding protein
MANGKRWSYENSTYPFAYGTAPIATELHLNFVSQLYTSEGETVEWLNYCVEKIWRSIDPQMFAEVEDILEDTIQSLAPGFIVSCQWSDNVLNRLMYWTMSKLCNTHLHSWQKAVKVTDFDIGVQAPRVQMYVHKHH